jgi:hypothetical protein
LHGGMVHRKAPEFVNLISKRAPGRASGTRVRTF